MHIANARAMTIALQRFLRSILNSKVLIPGMVSAKLTIFSSAAFSFSLWLLNEVFMEFALVIIKLVVSNVLSRLAASFTRSLMLV